MARARAKKRAPDANRPVPGAASDGRLLAYMVQFAAAFPGAKILHTLCANLSWSHFRFLAGIRVASYWTEMLPREQLQKKLHQTVAQARLQRENQRSARKFSRDGER